MGKKQVPAAAMVCGCIFLLLQASCDRDKTSSLTLIQPGGNATYYYGDTVTIKWLASEIAAASIKIRISTDNLRTLCYIDSTGIPVADSYRWIIGNEDDRSKLSYPGGYPSDSVRIVIVDASGAYADTLDGFLRVRPLKIIHPAGGETYHFGDTVTVRWRALPMCFSSIVVQITTDNFRAEKDTARYLAGVSFPPEQDTCRWIVGQEYDHLKLTYPSDSVRIFISGYDFPYYPDTSKHCLRVLSP